MTKPYVLSDNELKAIAVVARRHKQITLYYDDIATATNAYMEIFDVFHKKHLFTPISADDHSRTIYVHDGDLNRAGSITCAEKDEQAK